MKRKISLILTLVLMLSTILSVSVSAVSWPSTSELKTYVKSTGNNTIVYQTATSSGKYGTIYASDLITILGYQGSRLKVSYPTSNGSKIGYINKSDVTSAMINEAISDWTATTSMTAYRRSNGSATIGSVSKNDRCYSLASENGRTQIIYPVSGGYKIGWVLSSQIPNTNQSMNTPSSVSQGTYIIQSAINNNKVMDVSGGATNDGANIQLWTSNATNAQKFKITQNGSYYTITNINSGKVIDVSGGSNAVGANVQQWTSNNTNAQKWKFISAGNGYYYIQSALGHYIDVSGGYSNDGTNIHMYSFNGTNAQKWKLINIDLQQNPNSTPTQTSSNKTKNTMTNVLYNINITSSKISCGFDGYVNTSGRHEGIDFNYENGKSIYSLTNGVITNVVEGKDGGKLSTIAIYDSSNNKTVIYLHSNPSDSLYVGKTINKGDKIGTESWRGCSTSAGGHTHIEVRNGRKTNAAKSVGDYTLDNSNPKSYWNSLGYDVK